LNPKEGEPWKGKSRPSSSGPHGRGGFERFLLGSVASDVVRRGSVSFLVIPPTVAVQEGKLSLTMEAAAVMAFA
jgi:hypothetical protein